MHEVFNLGESETTELRRLVELLEENLQVKAIVDRQPMQPGAESAFETELWQCLPGTHEGFLGQVIRTHALATDQALDDAMDAAGMPAVNCFEGAHVAADGGPDQAIVGLGGRQGGRVGHQVGHGGVQHIPLDVPPTGKV